MMTDDTKLLTLGDRPDDWRVKAILATKGNQSRLGCILIAVLGKSHRIKNGSRFDTSASITSDGFVMCGFRQASGHYHPGAFVGSVRDLVDNFRGLADHLKLSDKDRIELFDKVKAWITVDYRAKKELF